MFSLALSLSLALATAPQDPRIIGKDAELIVRPDCAESLVDQADPGNCVQASTSPTLGMLYPLSQSLFVDPDGSVGVGTSMPQAPLHAVGADVLAVIVARNMGFGGSIMGLGTTDPTSGFYPPGALMGLTDDPGASGVALWAGPNAHHGVEARADNPVSSGVVGTMTALDSITEGVLGATLSRASGAAGVRGFVVEKRYGQVVFQVAKVTREWKHSQAKDAKAMIGKKVLVEAGKHDAIRRFVAKLERGEELTLDVAHKNGESLTIVELTEDQRERVRQ